MVGTSPQVSPLMMLMTVWGSIPGGSGDGAVGCRVDLGLESSGDLHEELDFGFGLCEGALGPGGFVY